MTPYPHPDPTPGSGIQGFPEYSRGAPGTRKVTIEYGAPLLFVGGVDGIPSTGFVRSMPLQGGGLPTKKKNNPFGYSKKFQDFC